MAWIDRERLDELETKEGYFDRNVREIGRLQTELDAAQFSLQALRIATNATERAEELTAELFEQAHLSPEYLEAEVVKELTKEEVAAQTARTKAGLREKRRMDVKARVVAEQGTQIRAELDEVFQTDGTYAEVDAEAEREARREIAADLIAERRKQTEAMVNTPENRAAYIEAHAEEIANDPRVVSHAKTYWKEKEAAWREEAVQMTMARVEGVVLEREDEIKETAAAAYAESPQGKRKLREIAREHESRIGKLGVEELLASHGDATAQAELAKARELAHRELTAQNLAKELALDFANGGIETSDIPENTPVVIQLGAVRQEKVEYSDEWGNRKKKDAEVMVIERELQLLSVGDGLFIVSHDSVALSGNKLAHKLRIPQGSVIKVGMLVSSRDAEGKEKREIKPVLKAGVNLQYDTDTSTKEFEDTESSIVNVRVGNVDARMIEHSRTEYL